MNEAKRHLVGIEALDFGSSSSAALATADALIIITERKEFRSPDVDALKATLRQPVIFDGCNSFDPALMREIGLEYHGIGRER